MKIQSATFARGAARWEELPADGAPEAAFVGRSNVGKSSLLNMLVGRKSLAHTSATPGKTRQFNYYHINERFYLVDLPGFGYARISQTERLHWARMIERYLAERETLRTLVHLVDARHEPQALDLEVMHMMRGVPVPYLIVLTKADKLSGNELSRSRARAQRALKGMGLEAPVVATSSAGEGRGREHVWEWLAPFLPESPA